MKKIYIIIALVLFSSACTDFLEEEPKDFLTPTLYPVTQNDVVQVMGGILDGLGDNRYYGRSLWQVVGFGADHICSKFYPGNSRGDLDHYTLLTNHPDIESVWESNYFNINGMNQILEALDGREENWTPGYRGAALTLRALSYFHLVQLFGDVPIVTKPVADVSSALDKTRDPVIDVYNLIISDLLEAETLLEGVSLGIGLPTVGFAKTLLANVYLTMAGFPLQDQSKWAMAAAKAKEVKASGTYSLVRPYTDLWLIANKNGPEHIFQIQRDMSNPSLRESVGPYTRPNFVGHQSGFAHFNGSLTLFNKFTAGDKRQLISLDTIIQSNETGLATSPPKVYHYTEFNKGGNPKEARPFTRKYFDSGRPYEDWRNFGRRTAHNFNVYRYAEVLLIIAEADNEANNGPTSDAYAAINEVRDRAGLEPLAGLSKNEFRDAVRLERELELCYELKRRFDLVRWGTFYEVMSQEEFAKDGIQPYHVLYPIPESEIRVNPNIIQNEGY